MNIKLIYNYGFLNLLQSISTSLDKEPGVSETGVWTTVTSLTKQRVRLNMKILGQFGGQPSPNTPNLQIKENKPTYREQFVPPDMSMVSYFLNKVRLYLFLKNII